MPSGRPHQRNDPSVMASVETALSVVPRPGRSGHADVAAFRRYLIARAWCVITPHRIRTGCTHAWVQTRDGRLPVVLYTVPADFGERVWLWFIPA